MLSPVMCSHGSSSQGSASASYVTVAWPSRSVPAARHPTVQTENCRGPCAKTFIVGSWVLGHSGLLMHLPKRTLPFITGLIEA